jgi:DNA-binding transcriptional regulator YiaG
MSSHGVPCGSCGAVSAYDAGCPDCRVPAEDPMTPADLLRAARLSRGLTQADAAHLAGVPLRTLQNWEIGHREPPDYVLAAAIERLTQSERGT